MTFLNSPKKGEDERNTQNLMVPSGAHSPTTFSNSTSLAREDED
jgi:hypothetical protein